MSRRRAVITGIGVVSPLGLDLVSFWEALLQGRGGVRPLQNFDASRLPVRFGGEVRDFDARNYLDRKDRKRLTIMGRSIQLGVAAAQLAMIDAHLDTARMDPTRFGVIMGSSTIPSEMQELGPAAQATCSAGAATVDLERWGQHGLSLIPPMWLLTHIPNMTACHISILHNAQGPNNTITQSEIAGALALTEAMRGIRCGRADLFLVGAGDTLLAPVNAVRHYLFGGLCQRNDEPQRACRPFDRRRDGKVLGEGGGVFVVEDLEHARRRGARIYAELVGFGCAFDKRLTGSGLARAIRTALGDLAPGEIGHINAQGSSTQRDDIWEASGIREVFGSHRVPVFAGKSYFGTLGAASVPVEMAASLLALENNVLPATLNYEHPDPNCPVFVPRSAEPLHRPHFLKIAASALGQTTAILCRKCNL